MVKKNKYSIINVQKEYLETLKPIATRKSSEMFLNIISKSRLLIGGSADLAGSNNTKTKNHKIIKPNNFEEVYSLWC